MRILQRNLARLANAASGGELDRLSGSLRNAHIRIKEYDREIERLKDDALSGWTRLTNQEQDQNRQAVRDNCRYAFQRGDAFIKGALRLMTEACFEQGVDGPVSEDTKVQAALDEFWNASDNQEALFSTVAQHRASNQLLVDGDYFAILRAGGEANKHVAVRYMPASYVVGIIGDPFDVTRVLYYNCSIPQPKWDDATASWKPTATPKTVFYRDVFNTDPANDPLNDKLGNKAEKDAYLQHTAINAMDAAGFGWPEPAVSLPWFHHHQQIAQDQAAVSRATAALMSVLKVDASSGAIDTLRDELRTRGQWSDGEANENVAAQINLMNQQLELSVNRASSRAGEAETNSRMFRMAGAQGLNMSLHYMADPENANLATAKSMDRPTLVHLRAYQSIWIDTYRKMMDFALARAKIVGAQYDIPAPRIARQDISEAGKLIIDAYDAGLITAGQGAASVLDMLGFDDIAKELEIRERDLAAEEESEVTPLETEIVEEPTW